MKSDSKIKLGYWLSNDIFYVSLSSFLLFMFLEIRQPGLISDYFNLNYLLIFSIFSGIIMAFNQKK